MYTEQEQKKQPLVDLKSILLGAGTAALTLLEADYLIDGQLNIFNESTASESEEKVIEENDDIVTELEAVNVSNYTHSFIVHTEDGNEVFGLVQPGEFDYFNLGMNSNDEYIISGYSQLEETNEAYKSLISFELNSLKEYENFSDEIILSPADGEDLVNYMFRDLSSGTPVELSIRDSDGIFDLIKVDEKMWMIGDSGDRFEIRILSN